MLKIVRTGKSLYKKLFPTEMPHIVTLANVIFKMIILATVGGIKPLQSVAVILTLVTKTGNTVVILITQQPLSVQAVCVMINHDVLP